ncbi:MAG: diguanylate cyclase [Burkholderiaceae bacterium]
MNDSEQGPDDNGRVGSMTGEWPPDLWALRAAVPELLANPVVITDAERRILWVNPAFEQRTDYTRAEVLGRRPGDFLYGPQTDRAAVEAMRERLDRGEGLHGVELLKYARDGCPYWVSIEAHPVCDERGVVACFISIETDIDLRKQSESALRVSEQRMRALFESSTYAVVVIDGAGAIELFNPAAQRLFGYDEAELVGREIALLLPPTGIDRHGEAVALLLATGLPDAIGRARELAARARGGHEFPVELALAEFPTPQGTRYAATIRDISQRCAMEAEARALNEQLRASIAALEANQRHAQYLAAMSDLLHGCNAEDEIHRVAARYLPRVLDDAAGALYLSADGGDLLPRCVWGDRVPVAAAMNGDDCWSLRLARPYEADAVHGLACVHAQDPGAGGSLCVPLVAQGESLGVLTLRYVAAARDASVHEQRRARAVAVAEHIVLALANVRLREDLREQAMRDPLTGLINRRYMHESFARELARCERRELPLAVLMIDVDHFKRFNDEFGHAAGDRVLRRVAEVLGSAVRREDVVSRYGGEEFLLVLPETDLETARLRAEQARVAVECLQPEAGEDWCGPLSISIGIGVFPCDGSTAEGLIRVADAALYGAKRGGRNRVAEATRPPSA